MNPIIESIYSRKNETSPRTVQIHLSSEKVELWNEAKRTKKLCKKKDNHDNNGVKAKVDYGIQAGLSLTAQLNIYPLMKHSYSSAVSYLTLLPGIPTSPALPIRSPPLLSPLLQTVGAFKARIFSLLLTWSTATCSLHIVNDLFQAM